MKKSQDVNNNPEHDGSMDRDKLSAVPTLATLAILATLVTLPLLCTFVPLLHLLPCDLYPCEPCKVLTTFGLLYNPDLSAGF